MNINDLFELQEGKYELIENNHYSYTLDVNKSNSKMFNYFISLVDDTFIVTNLNIFIDVELYQNNMYNSVTSVYYSGGLKITSSDHISINQMLNSLKLVG